MSELHSEQSQSFHPLWRDHLETNRMEEDPQQKQKDTWLLPDLRVKAKPHGNAYRCT